MDTVRDLFSVCQDAGSDQTHLFECVSGGRLVSIEASVVDVAQLCRWLVRITWSFKSHDFWIGALKGNHTCKIDLSQDRFTSESVLANGWEQPCPSRLVRRLLLNHPLLTSYRRARFNVLVTNHSGHRLSG